MNILNNVKPLKTALLSVMALLAGCMVGPDFEKPVIGDLPRQFRFAEGDREEIVNLKWWELFNDPVLDYLVATALYENKDLLIAVSRMEEARAFLGFTEADIYPSFDLEGVANRGNFGAGRIVDEPNNSAFITALVNWEIDFWGKFRRANESARAQLLASEYGLRTVQIGLISEVVNTYFMLLDFKERLKISKQTLESRDENLDIIRKRFDEGVIPEIDVNQAEVQREIAATAIPANERFIYRTENALSILLGRFPEPIKTGLDLYQQIIPPDIPTGLPSSLLERRPDIQEALYLLQAQNAQIGVAVAQRFPAISLTGGAGAAVNDAPSMTLGDFAWSIGAGLFGPIFNFGKDKSRVQIEEARTEQTLYQYQNVVLIAFREVSDALMEIQTYRKQTEALRRQVNAAVNANRLAMLRYDQGFSSYLEVLDSERAQFSALLDLSQATQEYYSSYVRLYKALGGGWISPEEIGKSENSETQNKPK
ncbi:efflux transporter outer membrane subunit [Desulfobacterota bacterium AH_259_B03_O07]|nr:efflux transporter outer membrane subunit [Desulfobacterota bacterium AH_259_B03_O07]